MINPYLYRQQCPAGSVPYVIRGGDTLYRIAADYNSTIQDIINANPNLNPNYLLVGQQICVPLTTQIYPTCTTTNYYVVREGDTLESIASYFNISYNQLYYSNYGIDPSDIYEDQILCIPVAPSPVNIIINVAERRLMVNRNGNIYKSYTIASENPVNPIPRGNFTILNKQVDPGVEHGARWLGLSDAGLGIHGINTPQFIEVVSIENSIVLTNQDISELFNLVPVGTTVRII